MKRFAFVLTALLLMAVSANAQKQWRLEVGTGLQPLHMGFPGVSPTNEAERELALKGQYAQRNGWFCPSVTASGVMNYTEHWELVLTGQIAWRNYNLIQYEEFGIDPYGRPRYNLQKKKDLGRQAGFPVASGTLQWRYLWNPWSDAQVYSGFGLGISAGTNFIPTPSITPLGFRATGEHLYLYFELPLGPYATFVAGGLGWTI